VIEASRRMVMIELPEAVIAAGLSVAIMSFSGRTVSATKPLNPLMGSIVIVDVLDALIAIASAEGVAPMENSGRVCFA